MSPGLSSAIPGSIAHAPDLDDRRSQVEGVGRAGAQKTTKPPGSVGPGGSSRASGQARAPGALMRRASIPGRRPGPEPSPAPAPPRAPTPAGSAPPLTAKTQPRTPPTPYASP